MYSKEVQIIINHLVDKLEYEAKMGNPRKYNKKPCDLNPIEHIWGIAKTQVARNNTSFKLDDVKNVIIDALNDIIETVIRKTFEHAKKVESDNRKSDGLDVSPIQEKIEIMLLLNLLSPQIHPYQSDIFIFTIRFFM